MEDFNSWKDLLNPEFYINNGGFWLILFIIFAETGLFIGFFLPGDSLLNEIGYYFGRKAGPALYKKQDTMLFKKKHLYQAHEFFEKNGALAIIMARFLPVVRTFTPIIAGIVKMDKKAFLRDNIIGAVLWSFILIFAGHYLDKLFMDQFGIDLKKKLEIIIIIIVLVTTVPVIVKFLFGKKEDFSKYENHDFDEDVK